MNSQLQKIFQESIPENKIDNELYTKYDVKKGLRNEDGTGVLIGLTRIADVVGYKLIDGKKVDDRGELYYRGIPSPSCAGISIKIRSAVMRKRAF